MTSSTTTAPPTSWSGWFRADRRSRWVRLVDAAPSWDDAWGQLLDRLPRGRGGESLVTRADQDPNVNTAGRS